MITPQQLELLPLFHRTRITNEYLDAMGHMNIRWYMAIFDDAAWKFFASFGMNEAYFQTERGGGFALQQFVQYLAEVREGETVAVRTRILGRSAKRVHFMHFMQNESTGHLACTLEVLGAHADMVTRRITPYPTRIARQIDAILLAHEQLNWDAPVCGVIHP
jgi:acyl-CoA thioester hydrolase